jgi:hypothetical protein
MLGKVYQGKAGLDEEADVAKSYLEADSMSKLQEHYILLHYLEGFMTQDSLIGTTISNYLQYLRIPSMCTQVSA